MTLDELIESLQELQQSNKFSGEMEVCIGVDDIVLDFVERKSVDIEMVDGTPVVILIAQT